MTDTPRPAARSGVRARLLAANFVVVVASFVTASCVAALVGPPMFQRLMNQATAGRAAGDHPYQTAFAKATAMSTVTALLVSLVAALALSWYFSRRVHSSTAVLARAATVIADGRYDVAISPKTGLGREFDDIAAAFTTMAQQLERVEDSRKRLLADLAHEIRTPVAVVDAYLEAVEDGVKTLDGDVLRVLRDQSRRLTRLSVDVASLSDAEGQVRTVHRQWLPVEQLVDTTAAALTPEFRRKGVTLTASTGPDASMLWADPERLGQVLTNVLNNALRHTPPGGVVTLTTCIAHEEVLFAVSDTGTGTGIPTQHLTRVFDRFYRVDEARDRVHGGAGIGLAIAKAFVNGHGGSIKADSKGLGTGATFTICLPQPPLVEQTVG